LIGQSLDKDLQRALGAPVRIANDADCFALSEFVDGAGMPFNNIFAVIMGTGVGGGLVINDHLVQGPNAISGEWGHNPLPWVKDCDLPQQQCYCKKTGCIETYLSGPGMSRQFSLQNSNKLLSSKEIVQALDQNNTLVESYWAQYIDRVARSLASVINIVDPEAVILGGGLSNIDVLYDQLPSAIDQYVFSDACTTPILKAKHSDSSGVRGAAWLWR
jgi:fructokinase